MSNPIPFNVYFDVVTGNVVDPLHNCTPVTSLLFPKLDYYVLQLQVVKSGGVWTPDSNGYAPTAVQFDLSAYTANPLLALGSAAGTYIYSSNTYLSTGSWWAPANGRVAIPFLIPTGIASGDTHAEIALTDSSNNCLRIPSQWIKATISDPLITTIAGSVPAVLPTYYGVAAIAEATNSIAVAVPGLTANAQAILSQKDNGNGVASFIWSALANQLIITWPTAPAGGWLVGWEVISA